jgi:hypothetical protein
MHFLARCRSAAGIHLSTSAFHPCGRLSAPAIVLTLLSLSSASAANEKAWRWRVLGDDVLPYLIYEASADENRFVLMCDNQRRDAEVSVAETGRGARRGQPVTVELTANGQVVTMKGSIKTDNGVYGHVTKAPYKAVVTLLRQPGPVTVKMSGNTYTLGERDRVKQLNEFASTCKLK